MNRKDRRAHKAQAFLPAAGTADSAAQALRAAVQLHMAGRLSDAVVAYRRCLRAQPNEVLAHNNLGLILSSQGKTTEAIACYRRAIELRPDFAGAHFNLGNVLASQDRQLEAVAAYRRAVALQPDLADIHINLGNSLRNLGMFDEASMCYRTALSLKPRDAPILINLGNVLRDLDQVEEALRCYRRAVALQPDDAGAHHNLGHTLLYRGEMAAGWLEYEWRWKMLSMRSQFRGFSQPQWRGAHQAGQTLLIHAEQGFGDTLQFCRYAPLAAERGLRVILEVQPPLARLLRSLPRVDQVLARGEPLPDFDLHCPMLSLPAAFSTTVDTVPKAPRYLQGDPGDVAKFMARFPRIDATIRVGLCWAGNSNQSSPTQAAMDRRRSLSPDLLAPLLTVPGVRFLSLQKEGPSLPPGTEIVDVMAEMADFADTAALIETLDLVISVDTAVAHLAAAMGKPVWLLNRFDSCWRWIAGREDSPWYPTLRLFTQPHPGDWQAVIAKVVEALGQVSRGGTLV